MRANIFSSLGKFADRQEENFLTESFVYLLNTLLGRDNLLAKDLLTKLCGNNCITWFLTSDTILITTQLTIDTGRPDIVISVDNNKVAFVEVKHDSSLGWKQLERYDFHLQSSQYLEKQLILLTRSRHSIQETTLEKKQFHHVCWYEISGWLSEAETKDQIVQYLILEFLGFLKEKEMTMEKIDWEYIDGVPAMMNLANMLGTAVAEALPEAKTKRTAGWNWMGYYIDTGNAIFCGFRYNSPLNIAFENNNGTNPTFIQELDLQKAHFFSLSAGEQLECLINFIQTANSEYTSTL